MGWNVLKRNYFIAKKGRRRFEQASSTWCLPAVLKLQHCTSHALRWQICFICLSIKNRHIRCLFWFFFFQFFVAISFFCLTICTLPQKICYWSVVHPCNALTQIKMPDSSLLKTVNTTGIILHPRQASQASMSKSRMVSSALWLPEGHRSIQLQSEMVMWILKQFY